jgi:hypothetical protein
MKIDDVDDMREALREETYGRRSTDVRVPIGFDDRPRTMPAPPPPVAHRPHPTAPRPYYGPPAPCSGCGRRITTVTWSGALIQHYESRIPCGGKRLWEPGAEAC